MQKHPFGSSDWLNVVGGKTHPLEVCNASRDNLHLNDVTVKMAAAKIQSYIGAQPFKFGRCTDTQLKQIELKQLRCLQGIGFDEARLTKQAQTSPFDAADSICSLISKLKQCDYIVDGITCLNQNEKGQYYAITNTFVKVAEGLCANKMKNIWGLAIHGSKCLTENGMDFIKCVPRTKLGVEVFLRDVNNGFCK
ncbi:hypothetical protein GQR58_022118 [Nymphon striatum]|nr:hypothetical protein GQR58_022118 [Nymphon striatum]